MKCKSKQILRGLGLIALIISSNANASEIGHYAGGLPNIRDVIMPPAPGFYAALYYYHYSTDQLNNPNGDTINSILINPGPGAGVTLNLKVDVDVNVLSPMFIWVAPEKILGARYAAYIAPSFADSGLEAALSNVNGRGVGTSSSSFGAGDMFVAPIWLGWSLPNWDFGINYGFYAPVGKYDTQTFNLPVVGPVRVESIDNIGYGFWEHQLQGTLAWYPMKNKATAVVTALTYSTSGEKEDFDITPGDTLTLNWGISQYLPLKKDMTILAELGVAGYDTWQITTDSGSAAKSPRDQVHGVGGQIGLTHVPWNATLNFHYFCEFYAEDRFQGSVFGITVAKKF